MFAKHGTVIAKALPLLDELVLFNTGGIGTIPASHVEQLGACAEFATLSRLDFTPDHYLATIDELRALLAAPHLPRLRYLRLGYHRRGEGFEARGAERIASCERLAELRFLEIAGNTLRRAGVEALFASQHFARLEVLRVPYNELRTNDADALIAKLEAGALPALRVLDVSNVIEAEAITKACSFYRNRVGLDRQQRILHVLAARHGAADRYRDDDAPKPGARGAGAQGSFTGAVLAQTGHYPFVERAKSGRSTCVVCAKKITDGELRIGIERMLDAVGKVTSWLHPDCRGGCPELQTIDDLDDRLRENSSEPWPPATG
jgi:hypothetical protein